MTVEKLGAACLQKYELNIDASQAGVGRRRALHLIKNSSGVAMFRCRHLPFTLYIT